MADQPIVHIGENSPEEVAYKLMEVISRVEGRDLFRHRDNADAAADRQWILDTYAECLDAVKGRRSYAGRKSGVSTTTLSGY